MLSYVHVLKKKNLGLDAYNHLTPLGSFLLGRSGSRILFRDKFQLITTGLLSGPQRVIWMMEEGSCSKVLFCLSACRVLQTLKHSIDVAFHSGNLHLKKSHKQMNC